MQKTPQLFGGIHGARAGTGKTFFIHHKHPAFTNCAQVPVVLALIQWLRFGIHRATLHNIDIGVCRRQDLFVKAHQLFFVSDHVVPASAEYYVIDDTAAPCPQQIGITHFVKNAHRLHVRIAGFKGRKALPPGSHKSGCLVFAPCEATELLQHGKHLLKGIHFKNKYFNPQRAQIFRLHERLVTARKLDDQIGRLAHHKFRIGAHVRSDGGQMLKPRHGGVGHCAGRQGIPCAKGQQKLIKSPVQGYYPPGGPLQAYLMAGIVADNDGRTAVIRCSIGGIRPGIGWRGAGFSVRTGG